MFIVLHPSRRNVLLAALALLCWLACDPSVNAQDPAGTLQNQLRTTQEGLRRAAEDNARLKQIAGFDAATRLAEIETELRRLITRFADPQVAPEEQANLRMLLMVVAARSEDLTKRNEALRAENEQLRAQMQHANDLTKQAIAAQGAAAKRERKDLSDFARNSTQERDALIRQVEALSRQLEDSRRKYFEQLDKHAQEITALRSAGQNSATHVIRKWTDATGQFSVQATFVGLEAGIVTLQREAGKPIRIPVASLSAADREYLASLEKN